LAISGHVPEVSRQDQLIFEFRSGAKRDPEKAMELLASSSADSFDHVKGDRTRGAAHLAREPEHSGLREGVRLAVDPQGECVRSLPDDQPLKRAHSNSFRWGLNL
jgi:hypothetical protein